MLAIGAVFYAKAAGVLLGSCGPAQLMITSFIGPLETHQMYRKRRPARGNDLVDGTGHVHGIQRPVLSFTKAYDVGLYRGLRDIIEPTAAIWPEQDDISGIYIGSDIIATEVGEFAAPVHE